MTHLETADMPPRGYLWHGKGTRGSNATTILDNILI